MMFPFLQTAIANLFHKPSTEAFPNPAARGLGAYRGRIEYYPDRCTDCGKCIQVCAPIAITKTEVKVEGGRNVTRSFDLTSCTFCGTCQDFCDEGSIFLSPDYHMVAEDPKDLVVSATKFFKDIEGQIVCDQSGCIYCGLCAKNCPQKTITVDRKTKTWSINYDSCVKCGICIGKCPKKVLSFGDPEEMAKKNAAFLAAAPAAAPAAKAAPAAPAADLVDGVNFNQDACVFCGACAEACPMSAIKVENGEWTIDRDACVQCGACVDACPMGALTMGGAAAAEEAPAEEPAKAEEPVREEAPKAAAVVAPVTKTVTREVEVAGPLCDETNCIYCGICAKNCPVDAIEVDRKGKTWKVDYEKCVGCGLCIDKCPKKILTLGGIVELTEEITAPAKAAPAPAEPEGIVCNEENCIYCGICAKNCPVDALTVDRKAKTWTIDRDKCVGCGLCEDKCPKDALSIAVPAVYAAPAAEEAPAEKAPEEAPATKTVTREVEVDGIVCDQTGCIYCGICAKNCPVDAITVDRKAKTWTIDRDKCVGCGLCADKCPKKVLSIGGTETVTEEVPVKPARTTDPADEREVYSGILCNEENCIYCGICAKNCPVDAITVDRKAKTWTIDRDKCVQCGLCEAKCPKKALTLL